MVPATGIPVYMIKPTQPANEQERLEALEAYQVLDTEAEKAFDDLTILASRICQTPIALVSLIDPERQWFKARVGLDACETERDIAFCAHAIHKPEVMEVQDTLQDERFWDNPLVTGAPFIRFYAGAPLITPEGFAIGTLCVIAPHPMKLTDEQKDNLSILARAVVSQLELRKKVRELDRVSQFKSDFLSNMSHEIRTPIHGISGTLHLLQNMALNREQNHLVSLALGSADALTELVNDILDLSRIEAGKLELQTEEFDLATLLAEVGATHGIKANEKMIELICPARHIPSGRVRADSLRLRQVLNNLISNAIKFTHEGFVSIDLQLTPKHSVSENGHQQLTARFEVKDSGIGLTEEQLSRLFRRFQQACSDTTHLYGGSGLGLNICQQLVEMMDGKIGVQSHYGEGSVFWFEVALESVNLDYEEQPDLSDELRVLAIHSRPATQIFLQDLFSQWKLEADVTSPGRAYKKLENQTRNYTHILLEEEAEQSRTGALSEQLSQYWSEADKPNLILMRQPGKNQKTLDLSPYFGAVSLPLFPEELLALLQGTVSADQGISDNQSSSAQQYSGYALIAEDNKTNQVVAKGLLSHLGLEVAIASDGYEALHKMREESFDIIFMDCQMPVMDGFRTTRELRQAEGLKTSSQVPVIALTANAMQDDRKRCLDAGMDEFLTKPIDPVQLKKALNRFLPVVQQEENQAAANTVEPTPTESPSGTDASPELEHPAVAAPESETLTPAFDFAEYSSRLSDDLELMQLVMEAAIDDIHRILTELADTPDDKLTATLHQLKGLVANCSAKVLLERVTLLEEQSKSEHSGQIRQQLQELISLSQSFEREMKARLFSQ